MSQRTLETRDALTFRNASPDDVDALVGLVNAAYRISEGHVFPGSDRIERTEALKTLDGLIVSEVHGKIAGCVHLSLDGDSAHFGLLSTDVSMQRRGIGSALIRHCEATARAAGCSVMRIEVVKEAGRVPFYERFGYRVTKETPGQVWNGGLDWGAVAPWHMVDMEKEL